MHIIKNDCIIKCTEIQSDTFNLVVDAHFTRENAHEKIDQTVAIFQNKKLPFSWWVGPGDSPDNLKDILCSHGFVYTETEHGMFLNLNNYSPQKTNKLKIIQASNIEELKEFDYVHVHSFGNDSAFDVIFSHLPPSVYCGHSNYRFYTGYVDGRAVVTGALVFHAHVVGIYFIATIPSERRKGYATEMMHHLLSISKNEEHQMAVLLASEAGKPVYNKLGFVECCTFQEFQGPTVSKSEV